jgi:hypothetical protein
MKTIAKQYQKAGNIAMVQVETLEGEGFGFLTAASAMESGILEIREVRQEGTVNTLLAINHSAHHYLLTDMDLLKGAKQNRVVNTSVLIAPHSKQEVHVSCVERSRWSYNSPTFKPGPEILDARMRAAKADSLKRDKEEEVEGTQSMIWGLINEEMVSNQLHQRNGRLYQYPGSQIREGGIGAFSSMLRRTATAWLCLKDRGWCRLIFSGTGRHISTILICWPGIR